LSSSKRRDRMLMMRDTLGYTYRQIGQNFGISHQRVTQIIGPLGKEGREARIQKYVDQAANMAKSGYTRSDLDRMTGRGIGKIRDSFAHFPHSYADGPKAVWWTWVNRFALELQRENLTYTLPLQGGTMLVADKRVQIRGTDTRRKTGQYHFHIRDLNSDFVAFGMPNGSGYLFYIIPTYLLKPGSFYLRPKSGRWEKYQDYYEIIRKGETDAQ